MSTLTEKNRMAEFLLSEGNGQISREAITLAATTVELVAGTVLARQTLGTAAVAAAGAGAEGANTGTGLLTMDATTPLLAGAKSGVYTVKCITAATNGGVFQVEDPDGFVLGNATVGTAFADDIKFTIADGTTADFIVGDAFAVTVAAGDGAYVKYADATAATLPATAVLYGTAPISDAAQAAAAIVRNAEVIEARLTGCTATAKAALATKNIIVR